MKVGKVDGIEVRPLNKLYALVGYSLAVSFLAAKVKEDNLINYKNYRIHGKIKPKRKPQKLVYEDYTKVSCRFFMLCNIM